MSDYLNLIYVGCTRSTGRLIIVGHDKHGYLKNWYQEDINDLVATNCLQVFGVPKLDCDCSLQFKCQCRDKLLHVTDLIQYRTVSCINNLITSDSIRMTVIQGSQSEILTSTKAKMRNGLIESTTAIYGVLIPILTEYSLHGCINIVDYILSELFMQEFTGQQLLKHLDENRRVQISITYHKIQTSSISDLPTLVAKLLPDFAFLAVCVLCYDSYIYPLYQIDHYEWLDTTYVIACCQRLLDFKTSLALSRPDNNDQNLPNSGSSKCEFQIRETFNMMCIHNTQKSVSLKLFGRIDDSIDDVILEYKLSKNFGDSLHKSQLILYLWISKQTIGYLYYPNCDASIKIEIVDAHEFNVSTTHWFNELTQECYQLVLD